MNSRRVGLVLAAAIALAAACSGHEKGTGRAAGAGDVAALVAGVPEDATAVLWIALPAPLEELMNEGLFEPLAPERAEAMRREVSSFLAERVGLDLHAARSVTGFYLSSKPNGAFAAIVRSVGGKLPGVGDPIHSLGDDLVGAIQGDSLVIGQRSAVAASLAVLAGEAPGLTESSPLYSLLQRDASGANLVLALTSGVLEGPLAEMLSQYELDSAVLSANASRVKIAVRGKDAGLKKVADFAESALRTFVAGAEAQKDAAKSQGDDITGLAAIVTFHHVAQLADSVRPKLSAGLLTIDFPLAFGDRVGAVAVIGILSAVAIPAFMKYIKKSKSTEARENLARIHRAAVAYYERTGKLPPAAPLTPANPTDCCEKCTPNAVLWDTPAWRALSFALDAPHYYSYQLEVGTTELGDGPVPAFTARAMGDLDCDGQPSTFEMYGAVAADGMRTGEGIYRENELE